MSPRAEIIRLHPIGTGLDGVRSAHPVKPLDDSNGEVDNVACSYDLLVRERVANSSRV